MKCAVGMSGCMIKLESMNYPVSQPGIS